MVPGPELSGVSRAQVHLVDQHAKKEFHVLQDAFKVTAISGDSHHKSFFACVVKQSDVVICTAQILQNALVSGEEDMHVELTGGCGTPRAAVPAAGLGCDCPGQTSATAHPAPLSRPTQISRCW